MLPQVTVEYHPQEKDLAIIIVESDLSEPNALYILANIKKLLKQNIRKFVLDLTNANQITGSGLGMLRFLQGEIEKQGALLPILCQSAKVLKLLQVTELDQSLKILGSMDEARQWILENSNERSP